MINRAGKLWWTIWFAFVWMMLGPGMAADLFAGAETITKEAKETVEATKAYTIQQKDAFQRKAQEELVAIQSHIIALRGKAHSASAATRAELQRSLDELERKKDAVKDQLDALRDTTDSKWHAMRSTVDTALEEIKSSYQKALSRLP
jgi:ABC-type phosphate transport system auxiliary subunit